MRVILSRLHTVNQATRMYMGLIVVRGDRRTTINIRRSLRAENVAGNRTGCRRVPLPVAWTYSQDHVKASPTSITRSLPFLLLAPFLSLSFSFPFVHFLYYSFYLFSSFFSCFGQISATFKLCFFFFISDQNRPFGATSAAFITEPKPRHT